MGLGSSATDLSAHPSKLDQRQRRLQARCAPALLLGTWAAGASPGREPCAARQSFTLLLRELLHQLGTDSSMGEALRREGWSRALG